ncbi:iron-containing alcohol dehydrogenase [Jinshanibacter sp. LJY008]|uniref:Iron-containing alcohol dehydrogenase n=1 Tax=Limnobaculum eriocheiris TaxID=2897391 RepID=A0A9X1SJJ8_9GAMM|nr:iron-containing alcohol dehydrogenase [Limnobaculum eriocheiris]MCD1124610.1 iron-containing alcohol dehydrogenase [Limnobaculum eriocheiris]
MFNFDYYNPTHIMFGTERIKDLGTQLPENAKVLITYGGGSAKRFGTIDEVVQALGKREYIEFGGIEPNPHYDTLMKAVDIVKAEKIDYLIAVGGGSVIDGTKFIAAAVYFENDAWETWISNAPLKQVLPIGCVLTLPATGSEMNGTAVISNTALNAKLSHKHPLLFPRFAILDPRKSYTLPTKQLANGVVDAFVHVAEQYLTYPVYGKVQDRYAEGLMLTLIEEGHKALKEPENYDIRAAIMWSATQALNGLIGVGVPQDWASHRIGYYFTIHHGLDHAQTLAILLPAVLDVQRENKRLKLLQYAERVWQLTEGSEKERINSAITLTRQFFENMGLPTCLRAYGIPESAIEEAINYLKRFNLLPLGEHKDISVIEARKILSLSY